MTAFLLPTATDRAHYSQRVTLSGRDYTLVFRYNQRTERYLLTLQDAEENTIVAGITIVSNWPLLRWYRYKPELPAGELIAQDLSGDGSPPKYGELGEGKRVELTYFPDG